MPKEKIKTTEEIERIVNKIRGKNKKIVTTNGVFDILHIGHIRYLQEAKKLGDVLIVGLNSDSSVKLIKGPKRPINNQEERVEVLAALEFIDYIVVFEEETPVKLLGRIKPDVHVKGRDYDINEIIEKDTVEKNGGKIELLSLVKEKSTTNLIERIIRAHK